MKSVKNQDKIIEQARFDKNYKKAFEIILKYFHDLPGWTAPCSCHKGLLKISKGGWFDGDGYVKDKLNILLEESGEDLRVKSASSNVDEGWSKFWLKLNFEIEASSSYLYNIYNEKIRN